MKSLFVFLLVLSGKMVFAQAINNSLSYRNISNDGYFRFNYENDYFSATDYYYTQGMFAEVVTPAFKKFPLTHLLIKPHASSVKYGLGIEHNGYTPTSIESDVILYGDRPFAAALFLKTFLIADDTIRRDRFTTSLSTGIVGPGAGGYEMQDYIHRNTGNVRPHGWQYQVKNDFLLNYEINYERNLINIPNHFLLNGIGSARLGTFSTKAALGVTLMGGFFNDPFYLFRTRKWSLYMYDHAEVQAIGYDATLQGGLFTKDNPYTIPADAINRIVFQNRYGGVFNYKWLYVEYYQRYTTREFFSATHHHSGGIQLGIGF